VCVCVWNSAHPAES